MNFVKSTACRVAVSLVVPSSLVLFWLGYVEVQLVLLMCLMFLIVSVLNGRHLKQEPEQATRHLPPSSP